LGEEQEKLRVRHPPGWEDDDELNQPLTVLIPLETSDEKADVNVLKDR
jgi:hypothetical protein